MLGQSILYCYGAQPSPAVLITPIVSVSNEVWSCSSRENYCVVIAWTSNTSDNILGSGHQISDLLQFNIAVCLLIWYPLQLCSVLLCPILSINEKWSRYVSTTKTIISMYPSWRQQAPLTAGWQFKAWLWPVIGWLFYNEPINCRADHSS